MLLNDNCKKSERCCDAMRCRRLRRLLEEKQAGQSQKCDEIITHMLLNWIETEAQHLAHRTLNQRTCWMAVHRYQPVTATIATHHLRSICSAHHSRCCVRFHSCSTLMQCLHPRPPGVVHVVSIWCRQEHSTAKYDHVDFQQDLRSIIDIRRGYTLLTESVLIIWKV